MSDEAKRDKAMEIDRRMRETQGKLMSFQKDLSDREREATRGIFDKMLGLTREIADADGFAYVFDRAALLVAPPAMELTNELVRKYNARFKPAAETEKKPAPEKAKKPAAKKDDKKDEAKK
jgi:outer membrane protein